MDSLKIAYLCFDLNEISETDFASLMSVLPPNRREKLCAKTPHGKAESLFASLLCYYLLSLQSQDNDVGKAEPLIRVGLDGILEAAPALGEISRKVGWAVAEDGKPFKNGVVVGGKRWFISLSHCGFACAPVDDGTNRKDGENRGGFSQKAVVCAAVSTRKIGVDIQLSAACKSDLKRLSKLAERFYSDQEQERMNRLTEPDQACLEFYKIWSQKESVIKLDGGGIKLLRAFSIAPDGSFSLGGEAGIVHSWRLKEVGLAGDAEGYISAAFYDEN